MRRVHTSTGYALRQGSRGKTGPTGDYVGFMGAHILMDAPGEAGRYGLAMRFAPSVRGGQVKRSANTDVPRARGSSSTGDYRPGEGLSYR